MKPLYSALKYQTMSRNIEISRAKADLREVHKENRMLWPAKNEECEVQPFSHDRILIGVKNNSE